MVKRASSWLELCVVTVIYNNIFIMTYMSLRFGRLGVKCLLLGTQKSELERLHVSVDRSRIGDGDFKFKLLESCPANAQLSPSNISSSS